MTVGDDSLFAALMATEKAYFRMGSQITTFEGGEASVMPKFVGMAGAAVIQDVAPSMIASEGAAWIEHVEKILSDAAAPLARIYVVGDHAGAARMLKKAGYQQRVELGFAGSVLGDSSVVRLCKVDSDERWSAKMTLHEAVGSAPDGHSNEARSFVALERAKTRHGLECYLAEVAGKVVGAIGAIWGDGLVRAKNVMVHPSHQRHGIGSAMLANLAAMARDRGIDYLGVFGIDGEAGSALYRDAGLRVVGAQVEWSKELESGT